MVEQDQIRAESEEALRIVLHLQPYGPAARARILAMAAVQLNVLPPQQLVDILPALRIMLHLRPYGPAARARILAMAAVQLNVLPPQQLVDILAEGLRGTRKAHV